MDSERSERICEGWWGFSVKNFGGGAVRLRIIGFCVNYFILIRY